MQDERNKICSRLGLANDPVARHVFRAGFEEVGDPGCEKSGEPHLFFCVALDSKYMYLSPKDKGHQFEVSCALRVCLLTFDHCLPGKLGGYIIEQVLCETRKVEREEIGLTALAVRINLGTRSY